MKLVSIVIPCYRSEDSIRDVIAEIAETFAGQDKPDYEYEVVLVNDCSPDGVLNVIKELAAQDCHIRVLDLARNFGQHSAIMAGFHYVSGDIVVCMDDDGQTPPNQIFKLINRLGEDCDLVFARYPQKKHSFFRNLGSFINEIMLRVLLGKPKHLALMSYFACKRYVAEEAKHYKNPYPYIGGLLIRATNKTDNVLIDHRKRVHGKSAYTYRKLLSLWMNGFTAFSVLPLRVATLMGLACSLFGFVFGSITVIRKLLDNSVPIGYSSIMAALMFIGGLILLMLGMLGEYLGRVYISINNSPQFVVRDTSNIRDPLNICNTINIKDTDTHDQD
ncbi:MAG: glycosyltransferase family 2 protein [Peptococcaceae bacterium]|nr:glycosyltransferase family 2 protein [Peptococcaceae bacterium]